MSNVDPHVRIAAAVRAVRGTLGMSQEEFAQLIGVSKPTLARIETLEVPMKLDVYSQMLKQLRALDILVDAVQADKIKIEIGDLALIRLVARLSDDKNRRSDRIRNTTKVDLGAIMKALSAEEVETLQESLYKPAKSSSSKKKS